MSQLSAYVPVKWPFGERSDVEPEKIAARLDVSRVALAAELQAAGAARPADTVLPTATLRARGRMTSYSTRVFASILADGRHAHVSARPAKG